MKIKSNFVTSFCISLFLVTQIGFISSTATSTSAETLNSQETILALIPEPKVHLLRGDDNIRMGLYQKAVGDYTNAIALDPEFTLAYMKRGLACTYLKDYRSAIRDFTEVIHSDPSYVESYIHRGYLLTKQGKDKEALEDFNAAISIAPEESRPYALRGQIYRRQGFYKMARADFLKAQMVYAQQKSVVMGALTMPQSSRYSTLQKY